VFRVAGVLVEIVADVDERQAAELLEHARRGQLVRGELTRFALGDRGLNVRNC
jgi:hypothetical protein